MAEDPILARMLLGRHLREYRQRSGKTRADLAKYMSNTKLFNLERGMQQAIRAQDVIALGYEYGVTPDENKHLIDLADNASRSGWTESLDVPLAFQAYIGLESECTSLCVYEPEFINGLFQTPEYLAALQEHFTRDDPDKGRQVLLKRQERYFAAPVADTKLILNEATLKRKVGGRKVLREQLAHLIELAKYPAVSIQVLPFDVGSHPSMGGGFTVMTFEQDSFPTTVYLEAQDGSRYEERKDVVTLYEQLFADTFKLTTPIEEFIK